MKLNSKLHLSTAILMAIVANSTLVLAVETDREKSGAHVSAEAGKLAKDTKDGNTADKKRSEEERDRSGRTRSMGETFAQSYPNATPAERAQLTNIETYLAEAGKISENSATVRRTRDAIKAIRSSRLSPDVKIERLSTISIVAEELNRGDKGSAAFSKVGTGMLESLAMGLTATPAEDDGAAKSTKVYAAAVKRLHDATQKSGDKKANSELEYSNASMRDIAQALVKVAGDIQKSPSAKSGQNSSDAKSMEAAYKNIESIMGKFAENVKLNPPSIKLAMLKAVVDWAKENGKDVNKAVSCVFNPRSDS